MSVDGDVEQLNDAYYRMSAWRSLLGKTLRAPAELIFRLILLAGQPKDAPKDTWLEYLDNTSREWATGAFKQLGVDVSPSLPLASAVAHRIVRDCRRTASPASSSGGLERGRTPKSCVFSLPAALGDDADRKFPSSTKVPLAGDTDRSHGVICTHTDITDRKRLQQMEVSHERSRFEEAEAQRQKADEEKCVPSDSNSRLQHGLMP